jgi:DNA-binding MarR family transcriptional regulator
MTENPLPRPSLGRALGEVSRTLRKLHHRALEERGSDFPSWMLLTLLNEQAAPLPVETVVVEMDRRIDLARPDVVSLLERTAAAGLIAYRPAGSTPTAELTEAGSAYFASLYTYSRTVTDAAADGIDPAALDAAITVLLAVEERAMALLDA